MTELADSYVDHHTGVWFLYVHARWWFALRLQCWTAVYFTVVSILVVTLLKDGEYFGEFMVSRLKPCETHGFSSVWGNMYFCHSFKILLGGGCPPSRLLGGSRPCPPPASGACGSACLNLFLFLIFLSSTLSLFPSLGPLYEGLILNLCDFGKTLFNIGPILFLVQISGSSQLSPFYAMLCITFSKNIFVVSLMVIGKHLYA